MQKKLKCSYIDMTVVNQDNTLQTFVTIPKGYIEGEAITLKIKDEQTKEVFTYTILEVYPNVYDLVYIQAEIDCLYEGGFFEFKALNSNGDVLYKDQLFSTNQAVANYSINKDKYTSLNTNNNDFIVIQ
jgi:hypothetical protein